jgi:phosphoacetylglucosamine mutase
MLDGDKIGVMVAMFLGDLVTKAKLGEQQLQVGVVQTAYANGSSTKYLKSVSVNKYRFHTPTNKS